MDSLSNKRSFVAVSAELNQKLKIKAAQESTSIQQLVTLAIFKTYPELKEDNHGSVLK